MFASSIRSSKNVNLFENNFSSILFEWNHTWSSGVTTYKQIGVMPNYPGIPRFIPYYAITQIVSRTNTTVGLQCVQFGTYQASPLQVTANISDNNVGLNPSLLPTLGIIEHPCNALDAGLTSATTFTGGTLIGMALQQSNGSTTMYFRTWLFGTYLHFRNV